MSPNTREATEHMLCHRTKAPQKDKFVLAVVVIDSDPADSVHDIPMLFPQEPGWADAIKNRDNQLHAPRPNHPEKLPLL